MKLKRLDLIGFKSFANKTQIFFDDGVTCVVGPNGCGKSNISDSIRWVLGERSAKLLRGSKMEDVIFNGTQLRKPTAMAEVTLTIENEDRGLPIDYNEVSITRRLYRNGDSEYLINKTQCRLKDIQDLILDTGIGSNSYSMIEQGRIDYILSADPDERRFLIEEAAGISKYKTKKTEALRKLDRTEQNQLRLKDIIQEVHKNIQYAERQARRAEKYKVQLEELKKLEIVKAFNDIAKITQTRTSLEEGKSQVTSEIATLEEKLQAVKAIQSKVSETLRGILDRFASEDGIRHGLLSRVEQIQQLLQFHQEKRMEIASRKGEIHQEMRQLEERIETGREEINSKREEVSTMAQDKLAAQNDLQEAEKALGTIDEELQRMREQFDDLGAASMEASSKTNLIRSGYHRLQVFLDTSKDQKRKREVENDQLKQEAVRYREQVDSCNESLSNHTQRLTALESELTRLDTDTNELESTIDDLGKEIAQLDKNIHEKETRLEYLLQARASFEDKRDTIYEGLSDEERESIHSLKDLIKAKPGFEWALEYALESSMQSFVLNTSKSIQKLVSQMKEKQIPSLNILIKDNSGLPLPPQSNKEIDLPIQALQSLWDVIEVTNGYEQVFRGLLSNTFVLGDDFRTEQIEDLLPVSKQTRFISKEGVIVGPNQTVQLKNPSIVGHENIFQQDSEIEELRQLLASLNSQIGQKRSEKTRIGESAKSMRKRASEIETQKVEALLQKESLDSSRANYQEQLERLSQSFETQAKDEQEAKDAEEKATRQLAELEGQLEEAQQHENTTREKLDAIGVERDALDQKKTERLKQMATKKARFENLDERNQLLEESLNYLLEHEKTDLARIETLKVEDSRNEQKNQELQAEDAILLQEKEEVDNKRRDSEVALELIRKEKDEAEAELADNQVELDGLASRQRDLGEKLHETDMKVMDLDYQCKEIHGRLQQTYQISLETHQREEYALEVPETELDEKVEKLRKRVESIGTVNLLAIEEYDELKERYDFLMNQQNDLDQARQELLETIRKINRTTKSLFEDTFNSVQIAFQEYYSTLFRGGQAKLLLLDDGNPLESGIDIVVRPPGKKLQHISLLSGGEKALTAIALLFSLFKIKPSPYCVLDEVDAPLDEANIDRFLAVLKTFLHMTQFIIVTHNRKTIMMGDSLYGVTMEEPGVSRLVSVKVSNDEKAESPVEITNEKAEETMSEDEVISATEEEEELSKQPEN